MDVANIGWLVLRGSTKRIVVSWALHAEPHCWETNHYNSQILGARIDVLVRPIKIERTYELKHVQHFFECAAG